MDCVVHGITESHTTERLGLHFTFMISITTRKTGENGGGLGRKTSVLDGVCKMLLSLGRSAYLTLVDGAKYLLFQSSCIYLNSQ